MPPNSKTTTVPVDAAAIQRAADVLKHGDLVAIPTETVYGLAGDATNGRAVAKIFEVKRRPRFNPLICHVSGFEMAETIAQFDDRARLLAAAFWPGPVTLVLPQTATSDVAPLATCNLPTVAVRHPRGVAARLCAELSRPVAAPSANLSGRITATRATDVAAQFADQDLLILDGGPCPVGLESTIVDLSGAEAVLLRVGGIARSDLEAVLGMPLKIRAQSDPITGPGQLKSHYAPQAAVRMNVDEVRPGEAVLLFGADAPAGAAQARARFQLSADADLAEAASNLFPALWDADQTGAATIAVMPVPEHGLGEAINDRLRRASAPRGPDSQ